MKINRPINVNNPILINGKKEYNSIASTLHNLGYVWVGGNLLLSFTPNFSKYYLKCNVKLKIVNWSYYFENSRAIN